MKLKLNWGTGIAATYILFMTATLIIVAIFMNQDVGLESKDYYVKGIKYQGEIDKIKRTQELPVQLEINVMQESVLISFPKIFNPGDLSGTINFYRPSDKNKDFSLGVSADSSCNQIISTITIDKGLWKVKIDWNAKGNSFFNEKIVMVN